MIGNYSNHSLDTPIYFYYVGTQYVGHQFIPTQNGYSYFVKTHYFVERKQKPFI